MSLHSKQDVKEVLWVLIIAFFWSGPVLLTAATLVGPNNLDFASWQKVGDSWIHRFVLYLMWCRFNDKEKPR